MTQKNAFDILKMGANVFLTGAAGSGKTYLLNKYISYLQQNNISVGITASTGIAATHMNGRTIHSWCGMGTKETITEEEIKDLLWKKYLRETILSARVLIIDEVSMLHAHQLDLVNQICKAFRSNPLPFGGLQVILCGDFFQLPPVSKNGTPSHFVFESDAWEEMNIKICYLSEQFRQEDKDFLQVLNAIRNNTVTETIKHHLIKRLNQEVHISIPPIKLFTHNLDVDVINSFELSKIKQEPKTYPMTSYGIPALVKLLKKSCLAPEELILKEGAIVMFVRNNFGKGYVNGTLGKVVGFEKESNYPIIETAAKERIVAEPESWTIEDDKVVKAAISQIPLRLAWAITVHKSQGMSLDAAVMDLSKSFEPGMGYVALSRVRTLAGIKLLGINDTAYAVNEHVFSCDNNLRECSKMEEIKLEQLGMVEVNKRQKQYLQDMLE